MTEKQERKAGNAEQGVEECASGVGSCRCSRCSLYRWYPPLLVVSTVMAGLFCALYLTKPVHVVAPHAGEAPEVPVSVPASEPATPSEDPGYGTLAGSGEGLDPMLGGLPGETSGSEGLVLATRGPGFGRQPREFQPLKVEGPREGLFVPGKPVAKDGVTEESLPRAVAVLPGQDVEVDKIPLEVPEPARSELVTVMGLPSATTGTPSPDAVVVGLGPEGDLTEVMGMPGSNLADRDEDVEPAPPASIIGEFYQAPPEGPSWGAGVTSEEST